MKKILFTVATLIFAYAAVALADNSIAKQAEAWQPQILLMQDQSPAKPVTRSFTGTITKIGDQFVLRAETADAPYQLDDQDSASKFVGRKVKVTGVLDDSNNTIQVQTIEEANA